MPRNTISCLMEEKTMKILIKSIKKKYKEFNNKYKEFKNSEKKQNPINS